MNNNILKCLYILGLGIVILSSCNDFEGEPLDREGDETIWHSQDPFGDNAHDFLYGIYLQIPDLHNRISDSYLDSSTDDGVPSFETGVGLNVNAFRKGGISPSNVVDNHWKRNYTGIRMANVFLKNIDDVYIKEQYESDREIWIGEAKALRAFFYFELAKRWGGVPIIGDTVYTEHDKVNLPRSSYEDVCQYILRELDEAYDKVYDKDDLLAFEKGTIDKGIVKALKSRVLLYRASPLNNPDNKLIYWEEAAAAAKEVIDSGLYRLNSSYKNIFVNFANPEIIFLKQSALSDNLEWQNSPVGYNFDNKYAQGNTSPSQNLVDAYWTINGLSIYEDPTYDPQNPYENRDERLKASVFYNGSRWLGRDVETFEGGLDKPNLFNRSQTQTGYYLRKFLGNYEESSRFQAKAHGFILIRYAEILLNYAEALNEVDLDTNRSEIEQVIFDIRKRAGILSGSNNRYGLAANLSQDEMRKIIHNERRLEFAFEEQRFWDLRRWKEAENYLNQPIKGVEIEKKVDGTFTYTYKEVMESTFDARRMYLYPIPLDEYYANNQLVQNPNWQY